MSSVWEKDPEENLDYQFDFSDVLTTGEVISTYTLTVPDDITIASDANTDTAVTFWIPDGTAGLTCTIACKIETSAGRIFKRSKEIVIYNK